MSAEEFEVIPSEAVNEKEMEIDDVDSDRDDNPPTLVDSNAQFVASQSVSPHVSQVRISNNNDNASLQPQPCDAPIEQKDGGIQNAMNALLISNSNIDENKAMDSCEHENEHEHSEHESHESHDSNSDMNCEQTASPKNMIADNIEDNVVIPWPPHQVIVAVAVDAEHKQVEQLMSALEEQEHEQEQQNEGMVYAAAVATENEGSHSQLLQNKQPAIVSNIASTTPDRQKRIYDNPYLNGSNSTPGGDVDDVDEVENRVDQLGEESDDLHSEHERAEEEEEEDDVIAEFTLGDDSDDVSNEEKEDLRPPSSKRKQQQPPAEEVAPQTSWRMSMLVVIFASMVCRYWYTATATKSKPETPKLHCPSTLIYAPMDGNEFYVHASHVDHPSTTQYEWTVVNLQEYDDLYVDGETTDTLLLVKSSGGEIALELSIWSTLDAVYEFHKQCSVQIVFYASPYFGIDLGTTYSCIAYQLDAAVARDTKIIVADPQRAEYCIPTAVYFPPPSASATVLVGEDALKKLATDPLNVVFDVKRIVGRPCSDDEIDHFRVEHAFNVTCVSTSPDASPLIFVPNLNAFIAPEQALSVVVAHLVDTASVEFGVPYAYIGDVVVSIPALFHNGQRKAIRSACELVGLRVRQLIVEPTAASLAYSYYSSTPADNFKLFLTLDIGGGTMDCSVLRCTGVDCQVLSVVGNSSLGGIDFDAVIREMMIDKYEREHDWHNIRTSTKLMAKFLKVAESVKKSLSVSTQHQITMTNDELSSSSSDHLNAIYTEKKQIIITRREFEQHPRTTRLIDSAVEIAKAAMNTNRIQQSNVRMILLIGGTTKIPLIQQRLRREFAVDGRLKLVFPADDPQLMVVKGSAIIGASIALQRSGHSYHHRTSGGGGAGSSGGVDHILKQIVLEDVIPLSLGFSICLSAPNGSHCGVMDVIIEKNSHYPTYAKTTYCQKEPTSTTAKLALYEGDHYYVRDNYLLSNLSIENIPVRDPNVCDSIAVEFIIDRNGIATLQVTVNELQQQQQQPQQQNQTLSVASKDGALSFGDIQNLKRDMIDWFNGRESIQNALRV